jgi:hypothetical protein
MAGNSLNLLVILLAILTHGSLTIFVVRSALRVARVRADLPAEGSSPDAMASPDVESLESVLAAVPAPGLCANPRGITPGRR